MNQIRGKRVLVTGACGTVGEKLIESLVQDSKYMPGEVIGLDNNESDLFFLDQKYSDRDNVRFYCGDIRDRDDLAQCMAGVDIVFHSAALKHVILSERSPDNVIQTNILGVQNIIWAANKEGVEKVVFTSSDKAVNPTNVMGTSKLMGERLMTAANSKRWEKGPVFVSTRFGNVLGSRGSVVPLFHKQIASGGPITITDISMTRFVMSIKDSVRLVLDSANLARGGEVFITKMPVIRIKDLASAMIEELSPMYGYAPSDIEIKIIGSKPGEKLYEELMSMEETRRTVELKDYFAVLPAFRSVYSDIKYQYPDILSELVEDAYVSAEQDMLSMGEIKDILRKCNLLSGVVGQ